MQYALYEDSKTWEAWKAWAEIEGINNRKTKFIELKELKISQKETAEDHMRDQFHQVKC